MKIILEKCNVLQVHVNIHVKILTRLKELKFAALDSVKFLREESGSQRTTIQSYKIVKGRSLALYWNLNE
jgi:hypothetical protein